GAERGAEELGQLGHGPLAVALEQQQGQQLRARQLAVQGQHVGVEQGRAQPACEDQGQQSIHLPPNTTESKYPWPSLLRYRSIVKTPGELFHDRHGRVAGAKSPGPRAHPRPKWSPAGARGLGTGHTPPNAPFSPMIPWTRAFGPRPMRVQKARARSGTARSTFIWEIPG